MKITHGGEPGIASRLFMSANMDTRAVQGISVVLVTHNSARCVGDSVKAVQRLLPNAEIIIVDNNSTDETRAVVAQCGQHVVFIESGSNLGFGRGCNLGAFSASSEWILFANPDVALSSCDPVELSSLLATERPFGLVAFATSAAIGRKYRPQIWRYDSWRKAIFFCSWALMVPRFLKIRRSMAGSQHVGWASGALFLVHRDEFLTLGGFDDRYFLYFEDVDLSHRYQEVGFPVRGSYALSGVHAGGLSSDRNGELRTLSQVSNILGALQYISAAEQSFGERAAVGFLRAYRDMHRMLVILEKLLPRSLRIKRKIKEISAIEKYLGFIVSNGLFFIDGVSFYPDALELLKKAACYVGSGSSSVRTS